jgi:hypothetical protein
MIKGVIALLLIFLMRGMGTQEVDAKRMNYQDMIQLDEVIEVLL